MKIKFTTILLAVLCVNFVAAQSNTTPCEATVLCQSESLSNSYPSYGTLVRIYPQCDSYITFDRSVYYKMIVKTSGTFSFKIKPQAPSDYDWAVWKNLSNCHNVSNVIPDRFSANDGIASYIAGVTANWDTGMSDSVIVNCDPKGVWSNGMTSTLPVVAGDEILIAINLAQDELSGYQLLFDGNFPNGDSIGSDFLCIEEYPPFKICDSGEDGTEIFNLNILRNYLFQNYLNGNTNFDINFYERETYILLGTPALTHATVTAAGKKVFCSIISPDRQEFLSINLEFAETKHTSAELTLCQNELPYTWNDTIFKVGTVSGDYVFRRQAASGCDSIITLSLVVNKKVATNFTDMIGEGNTYSKHGFDLPEQRTIGTFTFRQNLQTSLGCDSTVTLTLTVKEGLLIEIYTVPEICGDDYEFVIKYLVEPNVEKVSAFFDEKATAAGFTDISAQSVSRQSIIIDLPTNIRPDYYTVRLFFEGDGLTKEFRVNFAVLYPSSIIRQKWNDVLALQNANYNGGYTFSAYEWYRNNVKIGGESGSYLYVGLNGALLDFTAQYRARITRIDDGVTLFTCPITPVPHTDYTPYPTFVNANQYFTINITNKLGKITIYNTFGVLIREQNIIDGANQILAPNSPGAYILKISDKNSMLIVR